MNKILQRERGVIQQKVSRAHTEATELTTFLLSLITFLLHFSTVHFEGQMSLCTYV